MDFLNLYSDQRWTMLNAKKVVKVEWEDGDVLREPLNQPMLSDMMLEKGVKDKRIADDVLLELSIKQSMLNMMGIGGKKDEDNGVCSDLWRCGWQRKREKRVDRGLYIREDPRDSAFQ